MGRLSNSKPKHLNSVFFWNMIYLYANGLVTIKNLFDISNPDE